MSIKLDPQKLDPQQYCTLYVVRHGETVWNVQRRLQGHKDSPLTKNGIQQAKNVAEKLKHIHFTKVFSSDVLRTQWTAEIILLERKLAVATTHALRERGFGKYEGKRWDRKEIQKLFEKHANISDEARFATKIDPEVESDEEIIGRGFTFLREISVAYKGENVLVVTHGGMIRALLVHLGFVTYSQLPAGTIENTAYFKLLADGVDFFVTETQGINKKEE